MNGQTIQQKLRRLLAWALTACMAIPMLPIQALAQTGAAPQPLSAPQYAFSPQPTPGNPSVELVDESSGQEPGGVAYQWYAYGSTEYTVADAGASGENLIHTEISPCTGTYANGLWTTNSGILSEDGLLYSQLIEVRFPAQLGDVVTLTPIGVSSELFLYPFTRFGDPFDDINGAYSFTVNTLDSGYFQFHVYAENDTEFSCRITVTRTTMDKMEGQTGKTFTGSPGTYVCQATVGGEVYTSDPVTTVPHSHDMSVDCGQTAPVTFKHALTSVGGALYSDGQKIETTSEYGYVLPEKNYFLAEDLVLNDALAINDSNPTVNLCLNGHQLVKERNMGGGVISLYNGTLNLCDCNGSNQTHTIKSPVTGEPNVSISGGLVTTGNSTSGNPTTGIYIATGTLNLYGGTIAGSKDSGVYGVGTFHMYGGTVTHNAGGNGGVSISDFTMSGGSVTDNWNTRRTSGGGISANQITLSGSPTISGNVVGEGKTPSNLCLNPFATVSIGENFEPHGKIGVTAPTAPTAQAPVQITQAGSKDYSQYFTSDNEKYAVENSGEGQNQIVQLVVIPPDFEGEGTEGSPYVLNSYADLEKLAEKVNGGKPYTGEYFQLPENFPTDGALTTSIGTESNPFQGSFDGNGQTIRLEINTENSNQGLFGFVWGSEDAHAKIQNVIVSGSVSGGSTVGGVAGYAEYCDVTNCANTAEITGNGDLEGMAGGLVGDAPFATAIEHCYNTGTVTGSPAGGLVGHATYGTIIEHCYSTGIVTGSEKVGGLVGSLESAKLANCLALGVSVTGTGTDVGRVVGESGSGRKLSGCSAREDMTLTVNGAVQAVADGKPGNKNGADLNVDGTATVGDAFAGWNPQPGTAVWNIPDGNLIPGRGLPTLLSAPQSPAPVLPGPIVVTLPDGSTVQCGLEDALAAVQATPGSTLKLMNNVTGSQECDKGRFTIDLNGQTWNGGLTLSGSADVTILDSVGGGSIIGADGVVDPNNSFSNGEGHPAVELVKGSTASLTLAGNEPYTLQGGKGADQDSGETGMGGNGVHARKGSTLTVENPQVLLQGGPGGAGGEAATEGRGGHGCTVASSSFAITGGLFQGGKGGAGQTPGAGGYGLFLDNATALSPLSGITATGGLDGDNTAAKQGYGLRVAGFPVTVEGGTFQGKSGIGVTVAVLTVIDAEASGKTGLEVWSGGGANISGGTFTGTGGPGLSISGDGTANISGGAFTGTSAGLTIEDGSTGHITAEISGGTFTGTSGPALSTKSGGSANVSGGTFTGNHGPGLAIEDGGSAKISGGSFIGNGDAGLSVSTGDSAILSGGAFHSINDFAVVRLDNSAVSGLLETGFSYYQNGAEITGETTLGGKQLAENGTIAVAPAGETFYTISGTVLDSNGSRVSGADVSLIRGKETLARTTSAGDGTYSFPTVKPGTYNLVAQKGQNIKTILVVITEENQTNKTIDFPAGSRNSMVEVQGHDTPPAVVDGLDSVAESQEANTTVKLTVKKVETPTDAQDIKTEAKNQQLLFLDLALVKITAGGTTAMTTTDTVLEIVVPYDTKQTGVTVYRKHGNDPAEKLTALEAKPDAPADGFYWADEASGLLHVYASKFSTYAIGYDKPGGGTSVVPVAPSLPFTDVEDNVWYREAVTYVYEHGLMGGTSKNLFSPHLDTSRGMAVTILWRLEGQPESSADMVFTDVQAGRYYEKAVRWAAEHGIVNGCTETEFCPDDPVTREQLAAILHRYAQYKGQDVSAASDLSQFTDRPSNWARENVEWAVGAGILMGKEGGRLDPTGRATRAEAAVMLMRFLR